MPYYCVNTVHKTGKFTDICDIDHSFLYYVGNYQYIVKKDKTQMKYEQFRLL